MNYPRSPIGAMRATLDQAFGLQAVDCDCDRAAREQNFFPDLVNRQRPFVQQGFEHGEVAAAHLQLRDALFGVGLDRTGRLPQHEENVNTTSARQRFHFTLAHLPPGYLDVKILYRKVDVKYN